MNIYLIGYRCTGKTSVAEYIGGRLGWPVLDADVELVKEQKQTIAQIVDAHGWDAFRQMEIAVLKRLSGLDEHVVATGGGVILNDINVQHMRQSGKIILLRAGAETIYKRLTGDQNTTDQRPALTDQDQFNEIVSMLETREPLYNSAMDFAVDTDSADIETVGRAILKKLSL